METNATPRPWGFETWTYEDGKRKVLTILNGQDAIAQIMNLWRNGEDATEEETANATLIVKAVNAHDALVDALEAIYEIAHCAPNDDPAKADREFRRIIKTARAALNAAKGE